MKELVFINKTVMTKKEARKMINDHIKFHCETFGSYNLPITDEVVFFKMKSESVENMEKDTIYSVPYKIEQYTFKYLIKIAYDLEDEQL